MCLLPLRDFILAALAAAVVSMTADAQQPKSRPLRSHQFS